MSEKHQMKLKFKYGNFALVKILYRDRFPFTPRN